MKRSFVTLSLCLILCVTVTGGPLSAQEAAPQTEGVIQEDNSLYVINDFTFDIKGLTRSDALIRVTELKKGELLKGWEQLERYIRNKTQILVNQRVLEKARIDYTIGEPWADGKYPVDLNIVVEDTWNIIVVPYPKYSSNTGFELIGKARDYNFLGTMSPLRLDFGYKYNEKNQSSLIFELDSDIPFKAFGYNWNLNFDHFFSYRPEAALPYYYKNISGLSMELPFNRTTFTFGIDESFTVNEENPDRYKAAGYNDFQEGLYMSTQPYISWKIPTGLNVFDYGEITYTPKISSVINHQFPKYPLDNFRRGPFMTFKHSLGFNRIDWIGNYRKGFDVALNNSFNYDFHHENSVKNAIDIDYSAAAIGHFTINEYLGVSSNLRFQHWLYHNPDYNTGAGEYVRGILDKAINAEYMLSLNLDFPFRVLQFQPSRWFNTQKLRFFDFEMHFSPIVDIAVYRAPAIGDSLGSTSKMKIGGGDLLFAGGAELVVFPDFMRSLYVRVSLAWNFIEQINNPGDYYLNPVLPIIPVIPDGNNRELFIGIGHFY